MNCVTPTNTQYQQYADQGLPFHVITLFGQLARETGRKMPTPVEMVNELALTTLSRIPEAAQQIPRIQVFHEKTS